jgi:hypothetical protein
MQPEAIRRNARSPRQVWGRQFWTKALQFVLVNCALFAAYRVSFIRLFGGPKALAETPVALWTGLGLDAVLLALELGILLLAALVTRRLRLRFTTAGLWGFTCVNAHRADSAGVARRCPPL